VGEWGERERATRANTSHFHGAGMTSHAKSFARSITRTPSPLVLTPPPSLTSRAFPFPFPFPHAHALPVHLPQPPCSPPRWAGSPRTKLGLPKRRSEDPDFFTGRSEGQKTGMGRRGVCEVASQSKAALRISKGERDFRIGVAPNLCSPFCPSDLPVKIWVRCARLRRLKGFDEL